MDVIRVTLGIPYSRPSAELGSRPAAQEDEMLRRKLAGFAKTLNPKKLLVTYYISTISYSLAADRKVCKAANRY